MNRTNHSKQGYVSTHYTSSGCGRGCIRARVGAAAHPNGRQRQLTKGYDHALNIGENYEAVARMLAKAEGFEIGPAEDNPRGGVRFPILKEKE